MRRTSGYGKFGQLDVQHGKKRCAKTARSTLVALRSYRLSIKSGLGLVVVGIFIPARACTGGGFAAWLLL